MTRVLLWLYWTCAMALAIGACGLVLIGWVFVGDE